MANGLGISAGTGWVWVGVWVSQQASVTGHEATNGFFLRYVCEGGS